MPSAQDLLEAAAPHLARLDALDARPQEGAMQPLLDIALTYSLTHLLPTLFLLTTDSLTTF